MINFLLTLILVSFSVSSMASAPMSKIPTPGFYRFMLGNFEVTALSDGTLAIDTALLTNTTKAKADKELKKSFLVSPVVISVNAYLVNTGSKLILIDAGAAALFGPTAGKLIANLKASGYQPEQVDEVYITHMHNDHIGGLFTNKEMTFPNAIVRADQHDLDFWLSQDNLNKAPEGMKPFFQGPIDTFASYTKANKVKPFEGDTQLVDGIKALNTHGHTVGHTTYQIESKGQKLIVIGDLIHLSPIQLADPSVTIQYDTDSKTAAVQRKKIFTDAAKDGAIVGAAHINFPGLGRLRQEGKKFIWLPIL